MRDWGIELEGSLENLGIVLGLLTVLWLLSVKLRDASIIDLFWGVGFAVIAWSTILREMGREGETIGWRGWLLSSLVTIWGGRLGAYLWWRNRGKGEDRRYAAMRDSFGKNFWWISYPVVFVLQGVLMWVVSFPIQAGILLGDTRSLGAVGIAGMGIFALGLIFEAVGDWQLARFKGDPKNAGRVMDRGLWRYTRHPNYFGDFCVWWGLFLIAAEGGAGWTVFSPVLMSFLLLKVSGVSLLEKDIGDRRPGYGEYVRRTNAFFPGPPKE